MKIATNEHIQGNTEGDNLRPEGEEREPSRLGRKRDRTRDAVILDAAIEVLAQVGYAGMTMDMVAVRAKAGKATVYRRWSSKTELVLEGLAHMRSNMVDLGRLPDTGTLRGDLVGLIKPQSKAEGQRKLKVMAGLTSMLGHEPELTKAVITAINKPWVNAYRVFFQRAIDRSEICIPADLEMFLQVVPAMAAVRVLIQGEPVDQEYLVRLIDGFLLPALRSPE